MVELIITMVLVTIVMASFYSMTLAISRLIIDSEGKLQIQADIRSFTFDMSRVGRGAAQFYIHDRWDASGGLQFSNVSADGQSGDVLLLAFRHFDRSDVGFLVNDSNTYISRIVGFARIAQNNAEEGPVLRFELTPPTPNAWPVRDFTVHGIVANAVRNNQIQMREVIELSRGRADGRLFKRYGNHRFIVNGEIIHGQNPRREQRVSNTYNFTVSTRG
ncbi:MAG: hypothetical protein LR015_09380 [Verrucomicrobia bacterium]|nr:hypothetical protein [Verrucomicrobiota bacterium]